MSDTKYTAGPWKACSNGVCQCGMIWSEHFPVAVALSTRKVWHEYNLGEGVEPESEMHIANARLIAAAPDLLAACKAARTRFADQNGDVSREVWDANYEAVAALDAAIAKAGGAA